MRWTEVITENLDDAAAFDLIEEDETEEENGDNALDPVETCFILFDLFE